MKTDRDALQAIRDFQWDAGDSETEAIALEKIQAIAAAQLEGQESPTEEKEESTKVATVGDLVTRSIADFCTRARLQFGPASDEDMAKLTDEIFGHLMVRASKEQIEEARRLFGKDGEIEIDDDAKESRSEENEERGAYIEAWLWVPDAASDCDECGAAIPDAEKEMENAHHEESCSLHPSASRPPMPDTKKVVAAIARTAKRRKQKGKTR